MQGDRSLTCPCLCFPSSAVRKGITAPPCSAARLASVAPNEGEYPHPLHFRVDHWMVSTNPHVLLNIHDAKWIADVQSYFLILTPLAANIYIDFVLLVAPKRVEQLQAEQFLTLFRSDLTNLSLLIGGIESHPLNTKRPHSMVPNLWLHPIFLTMLSPGNGGLAD